MWPDDHYAPLLGCDVGVWWEGRKWRPSPPVTCTTSVFKHDSVQWGRGGGSKIPLSSTPTLHVGEWESFILYLTSRCLSGFWVESSAAGYSTQHDLKSLTQLLLSSSIGFFFFFFARLWEKRQQSMKSENNFWWENKGRYISIWTVWMNLY